MGLWFFGCSLFRLTYDIPCLIVAGLATSPLAADLSAVAITYCTLSLLISAISVTNGLFLILYDTTHSATIFGSLLFQQSLVMVLLVLNTGLIVLAPAVELNVAYRLSDVLISASTTFSLIAFLILWAKAVEFAEMLRRPVLSLRWANARDVSMGIPTEANRLTLIGRRRSTPISLKHNLKQLLKAVGRKKRTRKVWNWRASILNVLFRRASPAETPLYALSQNFFALLAIALVAARIIILLIQLQTKDFLVRTTIQSCVIPRLVSLISSVPNSHYAPGSHSSMREMISVVGSNSDTASSRAEQCTLGMMMLGLHDGMYNFYNCDTYSRDIQYIITSNNTLEELPKFWIVNELSIQLNTGDDLQTVETVSSLVPGFQPTAMTFQVVELTLHKRQFIQSSNLRDAVFGLNPNYLHIDLYPWTQTSINLSDHPPKHCIPADNDSMVIACGIFRMPAVTQTSLENTMRQIRDRSGTSFCKVTEDYRESSTLEVLGSIGGLLALLQGAHMFLFGRPLFWGMFGTKLIVPFGLVGTLAGPSFRQRLLDYYGAEPHNHQYDGDAADAIRMNRFLLDYVIDMGPAQLTSQIEACQCSVEVLNNSESRHVSEPPSEAAPSDTEVDQELLRG